MPQEQQFQGGTFAPISGLVEHTAKPLAAFNEVGDALQQRYWQAKQQYNVLDQTIKNMPMFDKDVDQQHIDAANKKISDTINPIIQNDDFHKAQGVVMDLTKEIVNDKGIKAVNGAVTQWQQEKAEFDKRLEKEPQLRIAEARVDAYARFNYRKQGGALDKNGNAQRVPIWTPTTNLDISEDIKRVQDLAVKLKDFANKSTTISTSSMNGDPSNLFAGDPDMQRALVLLANDKKTITSLTKERIEQLAKDTVEQDPVYKTKLKEIATVDLFNNEHKLYADQNTLYNVISNDRNKATKQLALSMSPTYKAETNTLIHNLNVALNSGDAKKIKDAKKIYTNALEKLNNSEAIIKEGSDKITTLKPEELNELYINIKSEALNSKVIHSADQFAFTNIDKDRNIVTTHLYDAYVRKLDKEEKLPILAAMDNGTLPLADGLKYTQPGTDMDNEFKTLESQYNVAVASKKPVPLKLEMAYKAALNNRQSITSALGDNYDAANQDTKNTINNSWTSLLSRFGILRHGITMTGGRDVNALKVRSDPKLKQEFLSIMQNPKTSSNDKIFNMTNYVLEAVPKSELLHKNAKDLIRRYGINVKMSTNDYNQVLRSIDKAKYDFATRVAKYTAADHSKDAVTTELMSYGVDTPETLNMKNSVVKQFFSGNFTDTSGKLWTVDDIRKLGAEYKPIDPRNMTNSDLNDNSETQVSMMNHHGAFLETSQMVKIKVPIYATIEGKKVSTGEFKEIKGFFRGGSNITNAALLTNMNKMKPILISKSDATTKRLAIQYVQESANNLGGGLTDETGTSIYNKINAWEQGTWNEGNTKRITVGGIDCAIKKVSTGYEVVNTQSGTSGSELHHIANIGDFITLMGAKKARALGLDNQSYELLVKSLNQ